MTEPAVLLDEISRLRARTRADRHAYVPPLFLFGVLVLLAPLWAGGGPPRFEVANVWFGRPLQLYWLAVVVGGFLATAAWYLHRGTRHGVRTPVRGYLAIGLVGVLAISFGFPVVESFAYRVDRFPYAQPSFTIPVAAAAVLALGGALWLRPKLPHRGIATAAAMLFGLVALAMLDLRFAPVRPYAPLVTIALGLVGLAWLERSRVLGVVSGLFAAAALLANFYNMQNVFFHLGVFARYEGEATMAFTNTLLPGLVLLAGGAFAAWHERRARA
jgi:hypothetical protein